MDKYIIYSDKRFPDILVTKARIKSELQHELCLIYYRTIDKRVKQGIVHKDNIYDSLKEVKQVIGNKRCYYCT